MLYGSVGLLNSTLETIMRAVTVCGRHRKPEINLCRDSTVELQLS